MKSIENKGFLTTPSAMGRSVAVKLPANFQIANKISGFEHISYGTTLFFDLAARNAPIPDAARLNRKELRDKFRRFHPKTSDWEP
jgi:hypothetical protein